MSPIFNNIIETIGNLKKRSRVSGSRISGTDEISNALSTTTSTSFQSKLGPIVLGAGTWKIDACWSVQGDTANMIIQSRLRNITDNVTVIEDFTKIHQGTNNASMRSGFRIVTLTGDTTFRIQWCSDNVANTAGIRRVRLFAQKVEA